MQSQSYGRKAEREVFTIKSFNKDSHLMAEWTCVFETFSLYISNAEAYAHDIEIANKIIH